MTAPVLVLTARADLSQAGREALTAARDLADGVPVVLVAAVEPSAAALEAAGAAGVDRVLVADVPAERAVLADVQAQVVAAAVATTGAFAVLLPSSFHAKEAAAIAAARLGAGLLIDVADLQVVDGRVRGGKRAFAGTWVTECESLAPVTVATLRPNAVAAADAPAPGAAAVEPLAVGLVDPAITVVSREVREGSGRPDLAEAAYVVAGGRGTLGDFEPVYALADVLGGAVGTTRDCVEDGWIGHELQVGQTGITIAPRLYIGAGISGAPHHVGGMTASGTIVVVNTDEDAPLVQIADLAIIGDAASVLEEAAQVLRQHKNGRHEHA